MNVTYIFCKEKGCNLIDVCIKSPSDSDKRCTSAEIKRRCDVTRQADGWPGAGRGGGAGRGAASRPLILICTNHLRDLGL